MKDFSKNYRKVYDPDSPFMYDEVFHYCPGCGHSILHKLIGEVLNELDLDNNKVIGVGSVGCSYYIFRYFNFDFIGTLHGRAPAVATGIKRSYQNKLVFTYQGDGDLASIGLAEIVHAAARRENFSTIFVNNAVYGMTGGQHAPTTLLGQITKTTPNGRNERTAGYPLDISKLLSTIEGVTYIERTSLENVKGVIKTKKAIKKVFRRQLKGKGFGLIEVLSPCPTGTNLEPLKAQEWVKNTLKTKYPIGLYKEIN
jgi:2-oxoglutarate ferredoxin oxidoreductase subunit beta